MLSIGALMLTQTSWYVAVWMGNEWGEVSESYPHREQARYWLENKKLVEKVTDTAIHIFPNFRTAQYYRKHGEYYHQ